MSKFEWSDGIEKLQRHAVTKAQQTTCLEIFVIKVMCIEKVFLEFLKMLAFYFSFEKSYCSYKW